MRSGLRDLHGIETSLFGVVGPTSRAEIAQEPDFSSPSSFPDGDEIEPAVVVEVDGRDAPAV
jgi:hypothetical protein